MNRAKRIQLEENCQKSIAPLLDEKETEHYSFIWEFEKFSHTKKLQVLTAERRSVGIWKEQLLSK